MECLSTGLFTTGIIRVIIFQIADKSVQIHRKRVPMKEFVRTKKEQMSKAISRDVKMD
jgi:hypothetical protein